jgi:hypothetical protein
MKTPEQNDEQLSALLQAWRVDSPLPPRFAGEVWRRVEAADVPKVTFAQLLRSWLDRSLARPAVALAYCTVLLAGGLALGFKQGQDQMQVATAQLEARYVQSISPYHKVHP